MYREKIESCTALPIKVDRCCDTQQYTRITLVQQHLALEVVDSVDRAILRKNESMKHLGWRLCGSVASYLSKTLGMY
jgi:hypothetical protein